MIRLPFGSGFEVAVHVLEVGCCFDRCGNGITGDAVGTGLGWGQESWLFVFSCSGLVWQDDDESMAVTARDHPSLREIRSCRWAVRQSVMGIEVSAKSVQTNSIRSQFRLIQTGDADGDATRPRPCVLHLTKPKPEARRCTQLGHQAKEREAPACTCTYGKPENPRYPDRGLRFSSFSTLQNDRRPLSDAIEGKGVFSKPKARQTKRSLVHETFSDFQKNACPYTTQAGGCTKEREAQCGNGQRIRNYRKDTFLPCLRPYPS